MDSNDEWTTQITIYRRTPNHSPFVHFPSLHISIHHYLSISTCKKPNKTNPIPRPNPPVFPLSATTTVTVTTTTKWRQNSKTVSPPKNSSTKATPTHTTMSFSSLTTSTSQPTPLISQLNSLAMSPSLSRGFPLPWTPSLSPTWLQRWRRSVELGLFTLM